MKKWFNLFSKNWPNAGVSEWSLVTSLPTRAARNFLIRRKCDDWSRDELVCPKRYSFNFPLFFCHFNHFWLFSEGFFLLIFSRLLICSGYVHDLFLLPPLSLLKPRIGVLADNCRLQQLQFSLRDPHRQWNWSAKRLPLCSLSKIEHSTWPVLDSGPDGSSLGAISQRISLIRNQDQWPSNAGVALFLRPVSYQRCHSTGWMM